MVEQGKLPPLTMAKEIHEQPEVVGPHAGAIISRSRQRHRAAAVRPRFRPQRRCRAVTHSACGDRLFTPGSSRRYWLERFARLSVEIDIALGVSLPRGAAARGAG